MITIDIAIPVLNEEQYLKKCLKSIINFEIPNGASIDIYILDGGSTDRSILIAEDYVKKFPNIALLNNKKGNQSAAMNLIIEQGKGDYILRLDAHTIFNKSYLKNCIETALRTDADNVGGILRTLPGSDSYGAKLVQALTSHPFGVGNSSFRVGSNERLVDTVPFGFYKRSIFAKIGHFDERLLRAQDYEFNRRIINSGGNIWLNPKIKADYFNQPSLIRFYKKNLFLEAPYNAYMWFFAPYTFSIRHSITAFFSLGVIAGFFLSHLSIYIFLAYMSVISVYIILALISSVHLSIRHKDIRHCFALPACFFLFHFLHGLGVLSGLINIVLKRQPG